MKHTMLTPTNMARIALCGALVCIGAFIQIPLPFMDYFTLQFFFVLMSGILLHARLGALSIGLYVCIGLLGLPVFAAGGGIAYIVRPSFGYLLGFIACAFVVGLYIQKAPSKNFKHIFIACILGLLVTYIIGLTYKYFILNYYTNTPISLWILFLSCFPLDLPGDFLFCVLASSCGVRLCKRWEHS